ncbi:hypothetical protein [Paraburkholderia sp. J12]|jgi:hypothetical protein|uniref:hypothetical protein n=1 Tax=Paraburkholderia sp. J12 TaxID=2805432 RepID=UPI002ABE33A8|nr:hypothetical protein [Paraburkholderia sp. J12]
MYQAGGKANSGAPHPKQLLTKIRRCGGLPPFFDLFAKSDDLGMPIGADVLFPVFQGFS